MYPDAAKESKHVLSRIVPYGPDFKLLGVTFDCKLLMDGTVHGLASKAKWKLQMLMRSKRSFSTENLIVQYKQQVLSLIECCSGAIYRATGTVLRQLGGLQGRFLGDSGITQEAALMDFSLAPLSMRRDIATLDILHRAAISEGPAQYRKYFYCKPNSLNISDALDGKMSSRLMRRSIYNTLGGARAYTSMPDF